MIAAAKPEGQTVSLAHLKKGQKALITRVGARESRGSGRLVERLIERFMEMGFIEGSAVEIVHEAPFGGDPVAVRVRGCLVGLRRHEASFIEVLPL